MYKLLFFIVLILCSFNLYSQAIVVDHTCTDLNSIPIEYIDLARTTLHIGYGHTSHGSQLVTGMTAIKDDRGMDYAFSSSQVDNYLELREDLNGDVGYYPQWVDVTNAFLARDGYERFNVIMWSWCGQLSNYSEQDVRDKYLTPMTQFEVDYPNVNFVYMTGHLDGSGIDGTLNRNNEIIREYCIDNNKILYDFADIESYDPDGNYYLNRGADDECRYDSDNNGSRDGNWAVEWCASNPGDYLITGSCAHSQGLNCEYKGRAVWWMLAKLAGWSGVSTKITPDKHSYDTIYSSVSNEIIVVNGEDELFSCCVFDTLGNKIYSTSFMHRLRLPTLANGMYVLSIVSQRIQKTFKITILN